MRAIPYLASLTNAQVAILLTHILENEKQYNIADVVLIKDDLYNIRYTLDKIEQEIEKELLHEKILQETENIRTQESQAVSAEDARSG